MADIVVIGSLNMDMAVQVERRPARGETVLGTDFFMSPGGKGANAAAAAGKLGASVAMIGQAGDDMFASRLIDSLEACGVDCSRVGRLAGETTGVAVISLDPEGDNSIVVAPGANRLLRPEDLHRHEEAIRQAKIVMVQLEIPLETVMEAAAIAKRHGVPVLLDPAPAQPLPESLLQMVDFAVPNENELAQLTGLDVSDAASAHRAAGKLAGQGVSTVLAKLGDKGVVVREREGAFFVPAFPVAPVDTTAAGDSFAGAFAASLAEGRDIRDAVRFASAVGAITVTRRGAQASMPDREEVLQFIRQRDGQGEAEAWNT